MSQEIAESAEAGALDGLQKTFEETGSIDAVHSMIAGCLGGFVRFMWANRRDDMDDPEALRALFHTMVDSYVDQITAQPEPGDNPEPAAGEQP